MLINWKNTKLQRRKQPLFIISPPRFKVTVFFFFVYLYVCVYIYIYGF